MAITYPQRDFRKKVEDFIHKHPSTVKVSRTIPAASNGIEGDIVFVQKGNRIYLYAKVNGSWTRFIHDTSISSPRNVKIFRGGFYNGSSTAELWIPLQVDSSEQTAITSNTYVTNFPWPYSGRVRKINYVQDGYTDADDSEMTIKFYKLPFNTRASSSAGYSSIKEMNVSLSSAYEMKEVLIDVASYSKGEEMKISFQSPNRAIKGIYFTIEIEFNI
jgi:hypothetical protein